MTNTNFDYEGARKAGYSPEEIQSFISSKNETSSGFDYEGAKKAGWNDQEISDYQSKQKRNKPYRDVVSEELRQKGYEPDFSEELERASEYGTAEATRGLFSGLTAGASEHVPGLETGENIASQTGKVVGSIPLIEGLSKVFVDPLVTRAAASPILTKPLESVARVLGWTTVGGVYQATEDAISGKGLDAEDIAEHAATWGALDAGLQALEYVGGKTIKLAKYISKTARKINGSESSILNDVASQIEREGIDLNKPELVAQRALELLENPKNFTAQGKIEKLKPQDLEPILPTEKIIHPEINTQSFIHDIEDIEMNKKLNDFSERVASEQQLGESIKNDIETQFQAAEQEYIPLYKEVEEAASTIQHSPRKAVESALNTLNSLEDLKTKPEGYQKIINTIENVLEDLGYKVHKFEGKNIIKDISGKPIKMKNLELFEEIPLSKSMELARRLNKIIDYDIVGPSIKNRLKPLVKSVKDEVKNALPESLREKYIQADTAYGRTAEKFANDSMMKIRSQSSPERIIDQINSPTDLQSLRKTLSPNQYAKVEREVLENLQQQPQNKAKTIYREIKDHLTDRAKNVAEDIIQSKNPFGPKAQAKRLSDAVTKDLAESLSEGRRPDKTLGLWKTNQGRQAIENTLKNNPERNKILDYLKKQNLQDVISEILNKDGKIDFKKLKELLKSKEFIKDLHDISGKEGVELFKNLEKYSKQIDRNISLVDKIPANILKKSELGENILGRMARADYPLKFKVEDFMEELGTPLKTVLAMILPYKIGIVKGILSVMGSKYFYKLLTKPAARKSFKRIAQPQSVKSSALFLRGVDELDDELDR